MKIEKLVVGGRGVHFEVACMDHNTQGGSDCQSNAADNGVCDAYELNLKGPKANSVASFHDVELGLFQHLVLVQTPLHKGKREFSAVNWDVQRGKQERNAANMIFVAVSQNQAANHLRMLL